MNSNRSHVTWLHMCASCIFQSAVDVSLTCRRSKKQTRLIAQKKSYFFHKTKRIRWHYGAEQLIPVSDRLLIELREDAELLYIKRLEWKPTYRAGADLISVANCSYVQCCAKAGGVGAYVFISSLSMQFPVVARISRIRVYGAGQATACC